MPLAVLDIDVDAMPDRLPDMAGHDGAVVLLRIAGLPAGQAVLPAPVATSGPALREQLYDHADSAFWEALLRHRLNAPALIEAPTTLPSATVAICTRDRTEDLENCLNGLRRMDHQAPILVIDNAPSTDATRQLVERYPQVRYVREPKPGLNNARNTALREAVGEVVAFIDDDATPDRAWLPTLLRNFADPTILAVTGLTMALELDSDAQIAFQRTGGFVRGFKRAVLDAGNCDPFHAWRAGAGVNMAMRRSVIDQVGWFDPALDAGTRSLAGGDTDYFRRLLLNGYRIVYDPQALNWHRHRRSMAELQQQIFGYEAAAFAVWTKALLFERDMRVLPVFARWLRGQIPELLRSRRSDRNPLPFNVAATQARGAMSGPGRYLQARRIARHG
ncbi:glycosyltransferase family 2 protein [Sphingomonas turrisvirgatae]|uniref:Glycosyl transferase family 2 n=1 Tax=Sphingomonas turrisvirgatae TaxID=1888892 RepID=A0A1E3LRU5_9SPHN|nr:glycosyltransferase [Sphingomonas turrisvirgatae]ODP36476.1 glycosyl transferase family 2 [Sphingomonas turrisvirgatae]